MSRVIHWSGGRSAVAAIFGPIAADLRPAAVPSLLLLLFWILEGVHDDIRVTAGFLLFLGTLWLLQVTFYVALMPVIRFAFVQNAQATMTRLSASIRVIVAVSSLALWTGLVIEHLP